MNIFNKVALQGLKKSRARTFVTIVGVVLSAAMITGVAVFGISLLSYLVNGSIQSYGNWHIGFSDVSPDFIGELSSDKEVTNIITFENIGYAESGNSENPKKPYFFIAGYSEEAFNSLPVYLLSGRLPQNGSEVVVAGNALTDGGMNLSVGDIISLTVGYRMNGNDKLGQRDAYAPDYETFVQQRQTEYTIVGICRTPGFIQASAPAYTLITKADGQYEADSFSVFAALKNPRAIRTYSNKVSGDHACVFNDEVLRFIGASDDKVFNTLLYTVGGIVVVIIMIGSIFLIRNAFNISLNERMHQFGILMSVGATQNQLRNSVLFEGLCIGAVGIPIGTLLGIGGISIVISVVADKFENILYDNAPLTLTLYLPVIIAAALVSLITILISAYIPARKAANTPVMECIRQTNEVRLEAKAVKTSKLAQWIYGLEGTLALKNFKRNKTRYRSIVLSLILSVVLFISTNTFVIYLKQASEMAVVFTTYDIGIGAYDMEDAEMLSLYEKLKTADGVYESSYQAVMSYSCAVNAGELSEDLWEIMDLQSMDLHSPDETVELSMQILFLDDSAYFKIIEDLGLSIEEYTGQGQNAKLLSIAKINKNTNRVMTPDQFDDMFISSSLTLNIYPKTNGTQEPERGKSADITFAEFETPDTLPRLEAVEVMPYIFEAVVPYSQKETFEADGGNIDIKGLTFRSKNSAKSVSDMEQIISDEGITGGYTIYNISEMMEDNSNMIFIANVFAYTFIVLISLIAAANVFNTISTNIKLRRRELAMLRSVGMSERDFQKMMNFECVFYGMRALVFGLPLAVASSWLIYKGMYAGGADAIDFVLPWKSIGISVFSVLVVIFVTMMYSVSRIKKENIIDALRDDMA